MPLDDMRTRAIHTVALRVILKKMKSDFRKRRCCGVQNLEPLEPQYFSPAYFCQPGLWFIRRDSASVKEVGGIAPS